MLSKQKLFFYCLGMIFVAAVCYFLFSNIFYKSEGEKINSNLPAASDTSLPLVVSELSPEEYEKAKTDFLLIVNKENPQVALSKVRESIKTNNGLLRVCHDLVHEIGHEAYEKYKDFGEAMKYQDEICNSGYLHGIIESYFSENKNIFSLLPKVCSNYPTGSYISWECFHGVGHGLMYFTENDLPRSLKLCATYQNSFAKNSCMNGVFMENFNSDQKVHLSKFIKDDDSFYPCIDQAEENKADCYTYAPTHYLNRHIGQYQQALEWCQEAEPGYRLTCISGVGSQSMKENINNPKAIEKLCSREHENETKICLQGMISLYIYHYGSLTPAKQLCEELEADHQEVCYDVIKQYESYFQK